MITITTDIDIVSRGVMPVIHLSQYDSDFTLVFNIYASEGTFSMPSGTTAEIRGTKTDGNGYDAAGTVSGTTVTITGDEQMTAASGKNIFEIALYHSNKRLNTINFVLDVERAALDADTITSESVLRELDAIIEGAETATEAAAEAVAAAAEATSAVNGKANSAAIAADYDPTSNYSAGDYVMYNCSLYMAKSDITAEAWTASHWAQVYDTDRLKELKNISLESGFNSIGKISEDIAIFDSGYYSTPSPGTAVAIARPAPSATYQAAIMPASEGDRFKVDLYGGGTSYQPWAWLDEDAKVITRCGMTNKVIKAVILAPEDAAYVVFNNQRSYPEGYAYKVDPKTEDTLEYSETVTVTKTNNYYWDADTDTAVKTSASNYYCGEISVNPGEKYHIEMYEGTSGKQSPILFTNDAYKILERYEWRKGGAYSLDVIVPEGAAKLLLTSSQSALVTAFAKINRYKIESPIDLRGKRVAIIGDSISTNGNYDPETNPYGNRPEIIITEDDIGVSLSAYATYYDLDKSIGGHTITAQDVGEEITFTPTAADVGKTVGDALNYNNAARVTWWEIMQRALGFDPVPVCWSGSSISSHEGSKSTYKTSYAWHPAQIRKCGERIPGTMTRIAPDIVFIYRGTNDMTHTPYAKLTDVLDVYPQTYPADDTTQGGDFDFIKGLMLTVKAVRDAYPDAMIFLCTLNVFKRVVTDSYPTRNGTNSLPEFCNAIRAAADFLGCGLIEFDKDGITWENCYSSGYITDSATTPTHPNDKGHKMMGIKALQDFIRQYNVIIGE
ncbi:MAG: SGNH/GDSL hydrolase family protein [Mogibacterium sp.]|nr:SGNH/GDSL hydrolase family protein [Mogibacterium sp.]